MSLLGTTNWSGFSLLSIDPGLTCTGWAVFKLESPARAVLCGDGRVRSRDFSENDEILPERLSPILDCMRGVCNEHRCAVVLIEQPPQTIYKGKMLRRDMLIAKAQSVFKTFAVCAALFADLRQAPKVQHVTTVLPVQWEYSKKRRGGLPVKEWSMQYACGVVGRDRFRTEEDQNVADAISMGHIIATRH